ncbi:shikimate dehydrogenase [Marinicella gelatinilytica]|uniref:shikimate dehydrogenase n=1 Tax=Marinicella gelatinilytica TaxID=2996017 RepID=UPI0022608607|nr:shikimate dehydrogenase [Marinicella gelatinilytica]MCX7544466.1 shikimate dehydrogenase [Marinicella gelatinilytica]
MIYPLALFGHPVKHSLSPQIHQAFARQFDLDIQYQLIDVSSDKLHQRVHQFFAQGGHGANITVPHKQAVMAVADHLTERAQQAGAVNTLFIKNQQLWGDNTDGEGLLNDFKEKHINLANQRILIIGAGGAVQGILPNLVKSQPESIHINNRTRSKADVLAQFSTLCYVLNDIDTSTTFDVIINGTSIGHQGNSPEIKPQWLHPNTIAYDLSYGTAAEPFLNKAKSLGIQQTHDGLGMLHHQAALSFQRWFGKKPCLD